MPSKMWRFGGLRDCQCLAGDSILPTAKPIHPDSCFTRFAFTVFLFSITAYRAFTRIKDTKSHKSCRWEGETEMLSFRGYVVETAANA